MKLRDATGLIVYKMRIPGFVFKIDIEMTP